VKFTGEIGIIKILDFAKLRGGIRIHIAAGRRAMKLFQQYYASALSISGMLSIPKTQISDGVRKLLDDVANIKREYAELRITNMKKEATDTLTLRIPISMKVQIEIAATKDGRTMNSWVNKVLKEKLNEEVKK